MKASFVLTLLALCLTAGAVEVPLLANALSFQTPRDALAAALNARDGRVLNSVSTQNTTHFYPIIEYGYYRGGTHTVLHYGVSIEECIKYCLNSVYGCIAVNYVYSSRICYEFKTVSSLSTSTSYATVLVKPQTGADPCSSAYMFSGRMRPNYYYVYFRSDDAPNAHDCCVKCRDDPESKCKAWNYYTSGKVCYLLDATPPLGTASNYYTGYAVIDPKDE